MMIETRARLVGIALAYAAGLAGCADTPRAAYDRMLSAAERFDPNAVAKTITGPPEAVAMMKACVAFGGAVDSLKRKVIAVRGPEQWEMFAKAAGIVDAEGGKGDQGPGVFAHMARSMLAVDKAVFVADGDNATALTPGKKGGLHLARIDGKWYVDVTPDEGEASGEALLTLVTAVREIAKDTRELVHKFDDPKLDPQKAGKEFASDFAGTMFVAVFGMGQQESVRESLAAGDVHKFWQSNSGYGPEVRKTHSIVYISVEGVAWGADRTPIGLAELGKKLRAMTYGKLMGDRQIVVEKARGVPDAHLLKVLRTIVDAGAEPMCMSESSDSKSRPADADKQTNAPK